MKTPFKINDGSRPTLTELGEMYCGERPVDAPDALAVYREEVQDLWQQADDFDFELLRAASHRVPPKPQAPPSKPTQKGWHLSWLLPAMALAMAAIVILPQSPPGFRSKSVQTELSFFLMRGGEIMPAPHDAALVAGDSLQFTYLAASHETMVLVGVDGAGVLSVYYPEQASDRPHPVTAHGRGLLDGALVLDDTPGTETFIALFSPQSVQEAVRRIKQAYAAGGHPGLAQLADSDPQVAAVSVEKR
jgi:hypothetical protein